MDVAPAHGNCFIPRLEDRTVCLQPESAIPRRHSHGAIGKSDTYRNHIDRVGCLIPVKAKTPAGIGSSQLRFTRNDSFAPPHSAFQETARRSRKQTQRSHMEQAKRYRNEWPDAAAGRQINPNLVAIAVAWGRVPASRTLRALLR